MSEPGAAGMIKVMRKPGLFYPMLLLVCWTGLIIAGTYAVAETTLRQYLARNFSTTSGKVVRSEVGHGSTLRRGIEIEYNYTVDGIKYTGHRFRYDDHNSALKWDLTVKSHPQWSSQTVYYNPARPGDSLLKPGVDGCDLLLLLFALPLNVLTYTLWSAAFARFREKSRSRPAGGVRISKQSGETRVSLAETPGLAAAFYGWGGAAFVAAFPVTLTSGFEPSLVLMKTTWTVVLAVGVAVFLWRILRKLSGIYDLRIDQARRTVTLPQTAGRQNNLSISCQEITAVSVQRRASKSPSGTHFSYLPALNRGGLPGQPQSIKLITWGWSEEKARAFSQWLSQELGVKFNGIEEESSQSMAKS